MAQRGVLLVLGLAFGMGGLGLVATFGLLAFLGMPMLIVGLGCISAASAPAVPARERYH